MSSPDMNDRSLLRSCDYPVLYRPVEQLRADFPDAPVAVNLDEALAIMTAAWRTELEQDRAVGD